MVDHESAISFRVKNCSLGLGNLRGYAYGANIGWVVFENTGAPGVDLVTGKLSGYAYSANCGWISLSNAGAFVQTDTLAPGVDKDNDGIADGWERTYTNTLTAFTTASDSDQDGSTDLEEYLAGTNPLDAEDNLRITSFTRAGTYNTLWWTSETTRFFRVERCAALEVCRVGRQSSAMTGWVGTTSASTTQVGSISTASGPSGP